MISRREFLVSSLATGAGLAASNPFADMDTKEVLALAGTRSSSLTNFTKMFPKLPSQGVGDSQLEEGLITLGLKMRDNSNEPVPNTPFAGYTYLGQFIDHDLTLDLTPLDAAKPDQAEKTPNFRTPFLDLDQLYGGGPNLSPFLYRFDSPRNAQRFLIGSMTPIFIGSRNFDGLSDDLPRNTQGIALVGDPRQDENLIIGQLHVAFLRLHNCIIEQLEDKKLKSEGPDKATLFEQARRLLTWHYQWVVRNDFLKTILDETVFDNVNKPDYRPELASRPGDFRVPVEFSVAAFRFGHSMVRNEYRIRNVNGDADEHMRAPLRKLLQLTGPGGGARPSLSADWKVNWRFFFNTSNEGQVQHSSAIDTKIAGGLYELSQETKSLFSTTTPGEPTQQIPNNTPKDLPVITLLRGARIGLPSGQRVAEKLGIQPRLTSEQIAKGLDPAFLKQHPFHRDTPLWYYILKESEVLGKNGKLGLTGSRIVADVVMSALLRDHNSYLIKNPNWIPTLPVQYPKTDKRSFDMSDLMAYATKDCVEVTKRDNNT